MSSHKRNLTIIAIVFIIAVIAGSLIFVKLKSNEPDGSSPETGTADISKVMPVSNDSSETSVSVEPEPESQSKPEPQSEPEPKQQPEITTEDFSASFYATTDLNIRSNPGTNGKIIGSLKKGSEVTVTGKCSNGWYRVTYNDTVGFCSGKLLSGTKPPENAPVPEPVMPYYLRVNLTQNIVTVYARDESGEYTVPIKSMACSVGTDGKTPTGTYTTSDKYSWRLLSGNVYGQYCTRITGHILFHSVPYFTKDKGNLEFDKYNKLGQAASLGCVRLSVIDAKWIYDNCPKGSTVTLYYSDAPEPISPTMPTQIDINDARRGWDPTDPDPNNPWLAQ